LDNPLESLDTIRNSPTIKGVLGWSKQLEEDVRQSKIRGVNHTGSLRQRVAVKKAQRRKRKITEAGKVTRDYFFLTSDLDLTLQNLTLAGLNPIRACHPPRTVAEPYRSPPGVDGGPGPEVATRPGPVNQGKDILC
jgi:hypothetical protein